MVLLVECPGSGQHCRLKVCSFKKEFQAFVIYALARFYIRHGLVFYNWHFGTEPNYTVYAGLLQFLGTCREQSGTGNTSPGKCLSGSTSGKCLLGSTSWEVPPGTRSWSRSTPEVIPGQGHLVPGVFPLPSHLFPGIAVTRIRTLVKTLTHF